MPFWIALSYRIDRRRLLWIAHAVLIVACLAFLGTAQHADLPEISSTIIAGMCLIPATGAALCALLLFRWRTQPGASTDFLASAEVKDHD